MKIRTVVEFDIREDLAQDYLDNGTDVVEAITDEIEYMFESVQHGIAEYSCCYVQSVEIVDGE